MGGGASTGKRAIQLAEGIASSNAPNSLTAKERWTEVRYVAKTLAHVLKSDDDDIFRVFKVYATKKSQKIMAGSHLTIEPEKLKMALASLGATNIDLEGSGANESASAEASDLDFTRFKGVAEKAIRSTLMQSIVKGASLDQALSSQFPMSAADVLKLSQSDIEQALRGASFISVASKSLFDSIQRHRKNPGASSTDCAPADAPDADPVQTLTPQTAIAAMEKYHSTGGFIGKYGDKRLFDNGLEAEIGLADPFILKAILREHIHAADSTIPFLTPNYALETTPLLEFARILGSDDDPSCLRQLVRTSSAAAAAAPALGPTADELRDVQGELARLADAYLALQASGGVFPGEHGDAYGEALVHVRVAAGSPEAAEALLDPLEERLAAALEGQDLALYRLSARRVEVAVQPFAKDEEVGITFTFPLSSAAASNRSRAIRARPIVPADALARFRDVVARAAGTDAARVSAEAVAERTFVYCDWGDEAELHRSLAGKSPAELRTMAEDREPKVQFLRGRKSLMRFDAPSECIASITAHFRKETEEMRQQGRFRRQARRRRTIRELMEMPQVLNAGLRVEEAIAVYQYTGPLFQKWNWVLRQMPLGDYVGNRYTTSIHALASAVHKLSQHAHVPPGRKVYRGLGGMVLDRRWFEKDARGACGGVELGFLSTTLNKDVALQYSGVSRKRGTVFEIEVGAIHCGAQIDFLSQYPREGELLFGPLSYLEVVDSPRLDMYQGEQVVTVSLRVSINLKALTIEEMLGKRKRFQIEMMENLIKELQFEAQNFTEQTGRPLSPGELAVSLLQVEEKLKQTRELPGSWFNHDENFRKSWNDALDLKNQGIAHWWLPVLLTSQNEVEFRSLLKERESVTPGAVAYVAKSTALTRGLIKVSIDEVTDDTGETALMKSAAHGDQSGVRLLICASADVHIKDKNGDSVLHYCVHQWSQPAQGRAGGNLTTPERIRIKILEALVAAGADIDERNELGYTPLLEACTKGTAETVRALLMVKANTELRDKSEQTALHKAARKGKQDVVLALIKAGADVNAVDKDGDSAIYWAGNDECRELMKKAAIIAKPQ